MRSKLAERLSAPGLRFKALTLGSKLSLIFLIFIAIVAIIGAAMLLAGKLSQSSRLASGGGVILLWTGPVAAILGGINGYVLWSQTAFPLGF